MAALVELSAAIRKERLECERRSVAIHEEFRQREVERARMQQSESDLKSWRVAVDLRALIAQMLHQASEEVRNIPDVIRWIEWANWVASGNDLLNKGVASFVKRYRFLTQSRKPGLEAGDGAAFAWQFPISSAEARVLEYADPQVRTRRSA
jgi:hypothetical protein